MIKPAFSVSFLLSINIFVWQNVLYFSNNLRNLCLFTLTVKCIACVRVVETVVLVRTYDITADCREERREETHNVRSESLNVVI